MKKRKLQTWKRNGNVIKGSRASGGAKRGQVSFCAPNDGLQESPYIDIKEAIGLY